MRRSCSFELARGAAVGNWAHKGQKFERIHHRQVDEADRRRDKDGARRQADWAEMRRSGACCKVRAIVELRPQEDEAQKHYNGQGFLLMDLHLVNKTELRQEWLRGQALSIAV